MSGIVINGSGIVIPGSDSHTWVSHSQIWVRHGHTWVRHNHIWVRHQNCLFGTPHTTFKHMAFLKLLYALFALQSFSIDICNCIPYIWKLSLLSSLISFIFHYNHHKYFKQWLFLITLCNKFKMCYLVSDDTCMWHKCLVLVYTILHDAI